MRPVKNKRRIDPRYFLNESAERDTLEEIEPVPSPKDDKGGKTSFHVGPTSGKTDDDEKNEGKEHDEDCDCSKCPEPKKKKKGKDKNGRELIQGEKELDEEEESKMEEEWSLADLNPWSKKRKKLTKWEDDPSQRDDSKAVSPGAVSPGLQKVDKAIKRADYGREGAFTRKKG